MIEFGSAYIQADRAQTALAMSARPDAPVVPDPAPRRSRGEPVRRLAATVLRWTADRVEPRRAIDPCEPATA
jgi:hypothetical protein